MKRILKASVLFFIVGLIVGYFIFGKNNFTRRYLNPFDFFSSTEKLIAQSKFNANEPGGQVNVLPLMLIENRKKILIVGSVGALIGFLLGVLIKGKKFVRVREVRNWITFTVDLTNKTGTDNVAKFFLCFKTSEMAETILRGRPATADRFIKGLPELIEFSNGCAAAVFPLQNKDDLLSLFSELNKSDLRGKSLSSVGGFAIGIPKEQIKKVIGLLGAKKGLEIGDKVTW